MSTYASVFGSGNSGSIVVTGNVNVLNFPPVQAVSGTVTVLQGTTPWIVSASALPLPTGAATEAKQDVGNASLASIDSKLTSPLTVTAVNLDIRDLQFATDSVNVSGSSVSVSNFPATQPISGTVTALQGTSPWVVSGTISTSPDVNLHDGVGNAITSQVNGGQRALDVGIDVAGVQVDPRDIRLLTASDNVTIANASIPVTQSGVWNINDISGTISLPTGASTLAAQNAGNVSLASIDNQLASHITVNQGTAALPGNAWYMRITDGSSTVGISSFALQVAVSQPLPTGTNTIGSISNISGTISLPTGASTAANQTTQITSLQLLDDVPAAMNAAFNKGNPIMGQLDDTSTVVATEDNVAVLRITAQRALHTNLRNTAGTEIATSANPLRVDPTGTTTQPISAASLPLPTGAATEATLSTLNGKIPSGLTVTSTRLLVDGSGVTQPVSGTVTANQGGAPWSFNQTQVNGVAVATGNGVAGTGVQRVTIASDNTAFSVNAAQSGTWNITNISGTVSLPTGASTAANQTTANSSLSSIDGKMNSLGQKTMASSMPVVIASDQSAIPVTLQTATISTYAAATNFIPAALLPTDIFTILGSGTKTVKVRKIQISGINTANTNALVNIIRRSTADSGGTSSVVTNVNHDTNDAAATAVVRSYTVNPTLGTTVGTISSVYLFLPALTATNSSNNVLFEYGKLEDEPVVLRGTSQQLAINLNGVSLGGTSTISIKVEWTEE